MQEDTEALENCSKELLAHYEEYCVIKKHFMPRTIKLASDGEILLTQEQSHSAKSSTLSNGISFMSINEDDED